MRHHGVPSLKIVDVVPVKVLADDATLRVAMDEIVRCRTVVVQVHLDSQSWQFVLQRLICSFKVDDNVSVQLQDIFRVNIHEVGE